MTADVELKPLAEGAKLDFGPETAEFAVRNLIYTADGHFNQAIPVGKYAVTISHGPEFDIVDHRAPRQQSKLLKDHCHTFHAHGTQGGIAEFRNVNHFAAMFQHHFAA